MGGDNGDERYEIYKLEHSSDIESSSEKEVQVKGPDRKETKKLFDEVWEDDGC